MKIILFNQNPMITKLLESVSKKLELSMEDFNHYQELSTRLKEDPEWILIADDECLEKLDQVDWLELKEIISQNKNSVCMYYKKGNEVQPFLEGFEMKIKKPFLPTEVLKVLQKKLGSNMSELEPSQNLDPAQEVLETNWDELENLGDLEALVQEEPNNEEQLLPTLNDQEEKEEIKEEVKETPQEEKPKDDEIQEGETLKDEEVSKELETQEELEIPKEETQEELEIPKEETQEELEIPKEETQENKEEKQEKTQEEVKEETQEEPIKEQEPIKEETQENKEEKQEKTQDSPSAQELEAMQELVKEIQENSNGQEDKKETQENTETPQELEKQELETPQEKETQKLETPQDKETQENTETPQEKTQKLETQEDHYESIEDIPEPVMAQAMGEELPFLNEAVAKIPNNENDTETPKESVIKTPQEKEESIETPKESDKTSSPLELHLNLQDLLKSLNQESLKSLLENKTLSIKITLEDKKPDA
ncbi:chemotaxis regulatory protein ChePep [Helicobacter pylori]